MRDNVLQYKYTEGDMAAYMHTYYVYIYTHMHIYIYICMYGYNRIVSAHGLGVIVENTLERDVHLFLMPRL